MGEGTTARAGASEWVVFLGLLALAALARWQTFDNPVLGFDEQFYLLVGDRMLHGAVPYVDIFDRKPIGLFLIYAAIRELGGDGFVQYKLVACFFAAATAFLIYCAARPIGNRFAAITAGGLYVLWLNFMEGEGGQAQVFYNLPVLLAAMLTWRAVKAGRAERAPARIVALGSASMLLIGIAIQIKYTVIFEGLFFGAALLWSYRRSGRGAAELIGPAALWSGCALLPTAVAAVVYWRLGALQPFLFDNFLSIFGRVRDPLPAQMIGFVKLCGILLPLFLFCVPSLRGRNPEAAPDAKFVVPWLGAAILGVLLFGSFMAPQYGMPILAPACIAAAPFFARYRKARLVAGVTLSAAFIAGQAVLAENEVHKGGRAQALAVARAAQPHHGCIYVYDGYPALYMLTRSCLPTRFAFPSHLSISDEASPKALGVDPAAEVRRILATRPEVIVDEAPAYAFGNPETRALVESALARDYHLATRVETGAGRYRLVYRLN